MGYSVLMTESRLHMRPVGGWVRDGLDGVECHDLDVTVIHPEGLDDAALILEEDGFKVLHVKRETFTIVARMPKDLADIFGTPLLDVVVSRIDGPAGPDGRTPLFMEAATELEPDLDRRDFTVNAMALEHDGTLIDRHGGEQDLRDRILRFVGEPSVRIREDGIRILRALRFCVTKNFEMAPETFEAINSEHARDCLLMRPVEMVDQELSKMLAVDSVRGMEVLLSVPELHPAIFRQGFHLAGSLKKRKF